MRLSVVEPGSPPSSFVLGPSAVVVGTGPTAGVRLRGNGIEREHARITEEWLEAVAPLVVGGVSLAPGRRRLHACLAPIRIGDALLYVDADDEDGAVSLPTRDLAFGALVDGAKAWPSVRVVEGPGTGARLVLRDERPYVVGRGAASDLRLDHASSSRAHLEVRRVGSVVRVRDLDATRGTFLGEHRLSPRRDATWTPHMMVRAGDSVLALSSPGYSERPALTGSGGASSTSVAADSGAGAAPRPEAPDDEPPPSSMMLADGTLRSVPSQRVASSSAQAAIAEIPPVEAAPIDRAPARAARASRATLVVALAAAALALVIACGLAALVYILAS